jgi:hypothetical protein
MALELHEAPDRAAVDPQIRLDMGSRLLDGGEVDAQELGAALQGSGDRAGQGGIVGFLGLHAR